VTWIISMGVAVVVCAAIYAVGRALRAEGRAEAGAAATSAAAVLAVLWIAGHTVLASFHQVQAGHVGVVYEFGSIVGQLPEGFQITAPWRSVRQANTQVQRHTFEKLDSFSEETQDVFITATLNYEVSPDAIQDLYRNVGPDYFDKLVVTRVNQIFKDQTVKYPAVQIAPNREEIRQQTRERLTEELEGFSIRVVDLLIDEINFNPEFKRAIEQKQIATQDALREEQRVRQAEFEAQQVVERARGTAQANRLLSQSLTPQVIQYQAIERLSDKVQIALIPSGQGVILDPATLLGQQRPAAEQP